MKKSRKPDPAPMNRRLEELSKRFGTLVKLDTVIDWENFREPIKESFRQDANSPGTGLEYDEVMMFKILVLQHIYNIPDRQIELEICDRLSFLQFLGIKPEESIPGLETILSFRQQLGKTGALKQLFDKFYMILKEKGIVINEGKVNRAEIKESTQKKQNNTCS